MSFSPSPFKLTEYENNLVQTRSFMFSSNPLRTEKLEQLIQIVNGNSTDELNRKGIIAELLAIDLISEHMNKYFSSENPFYEGKIITGRQSFLINSNKNYLAKLITENRIVILKKNQKQFEDNKFGFINIAEIDGLYMIKKVENDRTRKKEKKLIVVETKSSDAKINANHVNENIVIPLQKMYGNIDISYLLVGFKEELYDDEQLNILNNKLKETYNNLRELNTEFNVIHFPFKKEEFNIFMLKFESQRTGIYNAKAKYNSNNSHLELTLQNGKILKGNFTPE